MILSAEQNDALTELINIAFSRTAASLSDLTGHRVFLDVPDVTITPVGEISRHLSHLVKGEVVSVHQIFSGPISGDALLLLNFESASTLVDILTNSHRQVGRMDASAREALTEVGNILLNACLSMFGNLLKVHVSFSVPRLHLKDLDAMLDSLVVGKDDILYALMIYTNFRLKDSAVTGYMVIVLGVASLDNLIHAMEDWAHIAK